MNSTTTPPVGCSSSIDPRYFTLCNLKAVWGIVAEAVAGAGIFTSGVLLIVMVASVPFITDRKRKSVLSLQVSFLIFCLGLFGLSFAFIVGPDSITCIARRFMFGVLFAGCFACLLMHGLWLVFLDQHIKNPQGWLFWLGALGFWLVEVIINMEWMIIINKAQDNVMELKPKICNINNDFTMALIYVMVLLVAVVLMAVPSMNHKCKSFRQDAVYILITGILSICIWMVWIVLNIHGNKMLGHSDWDSATLAIALVSNGWVFLVMYTIPVLCVLTKKTDNMGEDVLQGQRYSSRSRVYDNIPKERINSQRSIDMGNISMYDLDTDKKLESPYSGYNGQARSRVYQATELAIISKRPDTVCHEGVLPKATALPLVPTSRNPLTREG